MLVNHEHSVLTSTCIMLQFPMTQHHMQCFHKDQICLCVSAYHTLDYWL